MPSPFPGMNPYLEHDDAWHDFHDRFLPLAAGWIESQLGTHYIVKIDRHVYIHEVNEKAGRLIGRPGISAAARGETTSNAGVGVIEAPMEVLLPVVDVERQSFLEIRDRRSRQVITVIELLSPSNKAVGEDRERYLLKRSEVLASAAHLVEIDLLRGGLRSPLDESSECECDYRVLISRVERRPRAGVWPVILRQPLPTILVPLRAPDADVRLDLQAALHRVYDEGGFEKYIYDSEPQPPLTTEDAAWASALLPRSRT